MERESRYIPDPTESDEIILPKPPEPPSEPAEAVSEDELGEIVLVPYESLPLEEQQRVTDRVVDKMRAVLRDIPDYALFASTAMYLNGKRLRAMKDPGADALLTVAPGDLDVAVGSVESLKRIRERLSNMPGVVFDNDGQFKQLPSGDAKVLAGSVIITTEQGDVKYDFEFFNESRIVPKDVLRQRTQVDGVYALNLDGLQSQYLNNLELEGRVDREVGRVMGFLNQDARIRSEVESGALTEEVAELLESLKLSPADAKYFFQLQDQIAQAPNEADRQSLISRRAILLTELKTKIPKRLESIKKVARLRGRET